MSNGPSYAKASEGKHQVNGRGIGLSAETFSMFFRIKFWSYASASNHIKSFNLH